MRRPYGLKPSAGIEETLRLKKGKRPYGSRASIDPVDEALMTYDLSDEALEAAARVDGRLAITVGYCATASSAWYCLPY